MKFDKRKLSAIEGHTEIRFTQTPERGEDPFPPFQIVVSKHGMKFEGKSCIVTDMQDLQDLAKIISDAWVCFEREMKVKIVSAGSAG